MKYEIRNSKDLAIMEWRFAQAMGNWEWNGVWSRGVNWFGIGRGRLKG